MTTITELRELLAKATPGPLSLNEYGDIKAPGILRHDKLSVSGVSIPCGAVRKNDIGHANRDLIIAAINALPKLLEVAERAKVVSKMVDALNGDSEMQDLRDALAKLEDAK